MGAATPDVFGALAKRYAAPEWAFLREVANGTGGAMRRSADAVAINLWPSRGLEIHGIEVKIDRSDWLRELKKPDKSSAVQKFCHRWWIAAAADVVLAGELPSTWGLMTLRGRRGLVADVVAPPLSPEPLDMPFVAALGRRMTEAVAAAKQLARQELELAEPSEYQRGYDAGLAAAAPELARVTALREQLEKSVETFEKASGVRINAYDGEHIGAAVKRIVEARRRARPDDLLDVTIERFERLLGQLKSERQALVGGEE